MAETTDPGFRVAHTMIRVRNLDKSLDFYCRVLGMSVLRQKEYPDGKFTNTFVGYGPEATHPALELTYNWGQAEPYSHGSGYGHVALEVPDVYKACEAIASSGGRIARAPGPMQHGTRVIAFVEDPDDYKIELLEPLG